MMIGIEIDFVDILNKKKKKRLKKRICFIIRLRIFCYFVVFSYGIYYMYMFNLICGVNIVVFNINVYLYIFILFIDMVIIIINE